MMKTMKKMSVADDGFTLIEILIALAIFGIIAAIAYPSLMGKYHESTLKSAIGSVQSVTDSLTQYVVKNNKLPANAAAMISDGELEADPLAAIKVDMTASPELNKIADGSKAGPATAGYDFTGNGTADTTAAQQVMEIVLTGVPAADARALSELYDGPSTATPSLTQAAATTADTKGRVEYKAPAGGVTDVYIFAGRM